jgi:hypothetical protein
MRWTNLDLTCIYFFNKLTHHYFKFSPSICNQLCEFFSIFGPVRFASAQLALSPPFSLPDVISPPTDVITPPHRVIRPSHWAKMSLLSLLHLSAMLYHIASPLKLKLKYWIRTTATDYPLWTVWLPPSTVIKRSSQHWSLSPPLNRISISLSH